MKMSELRRLVRETILQVAKEELMREKSPSGWSGTVKAMKKHPEIDNPFALANYMKKKGDKPHYEPEAAPVGPQRIPKNPPERSVVAHGPEIDNKTDKDQEDYEADPTNYGFDENKKVQEVSTTGSAAGYDTPKAFVGGPKANARRKKKAEVAGYKLTGDSDE